MKCLHPVFFHLSVFLLLGDHNHYSLFLEKNGQITGPFASILK